MSSTPAGRGGATRNPARADERGRTLAQWFCYIIGAVLILVGLLGFTADSTFDVDDELQGNGFLGFEVNGWHNIVHLASGLFLLAMAPKRSTARTGSIAFGLIYGVVTIIGLIDGDDVLGIFPVNPADNVLHILLTAAALWAGFSSPGDDRGRRRAEGERAERVGTVGEAERAARHEGVGRRGPGV